MAWHQQGTRTYYYRSVRIGGRPVRRYVGASPAAELDAAVERLRRLEGTIEAGECRDEEARLREAEVPLLELCGGAELLTRVALAIAGFHRHDRGQWRKRREPNSRD